MADGAAAMRELDEQRSHQARGERVDDEGAEALAGGGQRARALLRKTEAGAPEGLRRAHCAQDLRRTARCMLRIFAPGGSGPCGNGLFAPPSAASRLSSALTCSLDRFVGSLSR